MRRAARWRSDQGIAALGRVPIAAPLQRELVVDAAGNVRGRHDRNVDHDRRTAGGPLVVLREALRQRRGRPRLDTVNIAAAAAADRSSSQRSTTASLAMGLGFDGREPPSTNTSIATLTVDDSVDCTEA